MTNNSTKAFDAVNTTFYKAEIALADLPDAAISFPDTGSRVGLQFWIALAAECSALMELYPDQADNIANEYNSLWNEWKRRRGDYE